MVKEITGAVIGSIVTGVLGFITLASLGLLKKTIEDDQIYQVASSIVNTESYRELLIDKMDKSGKFVGPIGPKGPIGPQGIPTSYKFRPGPTITISANGHGRANASCSKNEVIIGLSCSTSNETLAVFNAGSEINIEENSGVCKFNSSYDAGGKTAKATAVCASLR